MLLLLSLIRVSISCATVYKGIKDMIWIALIFWYDLIVPSHFWIFGSDQNATSLGVWLVWANIYFIVKRNIMLEKKKEKVAFFKITFWSFFCFYFILFIFYSFILVWFLSCCDSLSDFTFINYYYYFSIL